VARNAACSMSFSGRGAGIRAADMGPACRETCPRQSRPASALASLHGFGPSVCLAAPRKKDKKTRGPCQIHVPDSYFPVPWGDPAGWIWACGAHTPRRVVFLPLGLLHFYVQTSVEGLPESGAGNSVSPRPAAYSTDSRADRRRMNTSVPSVSTARVTATMPHSETAGMGSNCTKRLHRRRRPSAGRLAYPSGSSNLWSGPRSLRLALTTEDSTRTCYESVAAAVCA
jgi:hypothetical protein